MSKLLLVVNVGSTSVKTQVFNADLQSQAILTADYTHPGLVVLEGVDWHRRVINEQLNTIADIADLLATVLDRWQHWLIAENLALAGIGHRIVHGADWFDTLTPLNPELLLQLAELDAYAPLHNPFNRLGAEKTLARFPDTPQFALFDTAFHRHITEVAKRYAIPDFLSKSVAFYRYGFHGLSCQHSLTTAAQLLASEASSLNLIILHLGGGASVTAVRSGFSVDTSMGFSPTEGLMMASRCGDIDPMILLTLQQQGMSVPELSEALNHQSGLQGICGDSDMRRILQRAEAGDTKASLAIDMYCYRIKKYIGAYCAILGKVSALIFTGGIGEHAAEIRSRVVNGLEPLGFELNTQANQNLTANADISTSASLSRILVIHAEEERVCAKQMLAFLDKPSNQISPTFTTRKHNGI